MFTGLVEEVGRITAVSAEAGDARRLTIAMQLGDEVLPLGASLAVDGVCLTVVESRAHQVALVAAPETLGLTTLGALRSGDPVNLERPLRVGDRLGGHMVAGHVDGTGSVAAHGQRGAAVDVTIATPPALLRYIVAKGSIAIDGVSLTVNQVDNRGFTVSLIPHTQSATTLARKAIGAKVNLEVDLIGKYVEKLLAGHLPLNGITVDTLRENGFA